MSSRLVRRMEGGREGGSLSLTPSTRLYLMRGLLHGARDRAA
ncbi:hypothetical protein D187_008584 [Cystobacter fuscus DSM 2262]|uniref:Uncharacterized protein n=1 Tax=Cystobacter fuscus (strain ATCC 25194 / DSM 2262 / NBRC 100088 / M29) TaxID=1242864 RepID=S9PH26_CYSF2|nr:hypothetical protein D187_008584 [Cystobacter fuscus DSM 2262]